MLSLECKAWCIIIIIIITCKFFTPTLADGLRLESERDSKSLQVSSILLSIVKGYSAFIKPPALLEPNHQIV